MELNFNQFFGYEATINKHPDQVLIYGFAGIIFTIMTLLFIIFIFRKTGLNFINTHFTHPLTLSLGLCLLIAIFPTVVLKFVANDISGVKLIYCWITIFIGITIFCFLKFGMIKNWLSSARS